MIQMLLNNRYQIIRTLGSGGFGDTFLAEDTQMPSQRRCVIKQLKPIEHNSQIYQLVQERFGREAAILEELGGLSEQIPTLYAYFNLEKKFYLVQEWIEGDTLSRVVQQQGLFSESRVKEILISILPVLEFVHSKRIVHRDIKPDNIILRGDGKPVLIDFGAVRETMATMVNSQGSLTRSIVIGTPGYMPSEQAAGRAVYSSDLYSLGLTVVYLLCGKSPQILGTDSQTGEIIWESEVGNIGSSLKAIINKAIAYHPRERYSTALEMLEDLQKSATPPPATLPFQHQTDNTKAPTILADTERHVSDQQATKYQEDKPSNRPSKTLPILLPSVILASVIGLLAIGGFWFLIPRNTISQSQIQSNIQPEPESSLPKKVNYFWLSWRRATDADLESMDGFSLDIMRNSVFARHGRRFNNPGLQEYFDKQSWYNPKYSPEEFPSNKLSDLERRNVEYIAEYQDRTNKRFFDK
ncbi:MAG: YARHG domain-containing protein [Cyanobacteria bacterium J06573_2]